MAKTNFIPRIINFEPIDYQIVRRFADEMRLGKKGFSAALRTIIREWYSSRAILPSLNQDLPRAGQEPDSAEAIAITRRLFQAQMTQEARLKEGLDARERLRKQQESDFRYFIPPSNKS